MNDEITVNGSVFSLGNAGGSATSGLNPDTGNFATQTLNQDLEPLRVGEGAEKARNFGLGLNIRDTDTNFTRDIIDNEIRDKTMGRDFTENLLNEEQCEKIQTCIDSLQTELCGTVFQAREDLIDCADKIFDLACSQEERMLENIKCQIEAAKCQFYRQASARWAQVSRAVGSSRNTFVIQQQDTAMVDLTRALASLRAELHNSAIVQSQQSLERAFSVKAVSRIDNYEASYGNMLSLWGLIRGAKRVVDEDVIEGNTIDRTSNEVSFQDVTTFDWAGKYAEKVTLATTVETDYLSDYQQANSLVGLLGIFTP